MRFELIFFIVLFLIVIRSHGQTTDELKMTSYGLEAPPEILDLDDDDPLKLGYLKKQKKRTRNRQMLEMALNYSPTSFISPWYADPFHPKKKPYILHADIIPQFSIGGEWLSTPILLTTRYKVRIFSNDPSSRDVSLPVRTPSYMPGATVFIPLQRQITPETKVVRFLSIAGFHHSNGQDAPEFNEDNTFNKYNGNFSTNHFEPSFWYRKRKGGELAAIPLFERARKPYVDFFIKGGYEINFGTADVLKPSYGAGRFNLNIGWIKVINYRDTYGTTGFAFENPYWRELFRVLFSGTYITGKRSLGLDKIGKRINTELSGHLRIKGSANTAMMIAGGYYGSDPYNIYYEDNYGYLRLGLSTGLFISPGRTSLAGK